MEPRCTIYEFEKATGGEEHLENILGILESKGLKTIRTDLKRREVISENEGVNHVLATIERGDSDSYINFTVWELSKLWALELPNFHPYRTNITNKDRDDREIIRQVLREYRP